MCGMECFDNLLSKVGRNNNSSSKSAGDCFRYVISKSWRYNNLVPHQDNTIQDVEVVADIPVGDEI